MTRSFLFSITAAAIAIVLWVLVILGPAHPSVSGEWVRGIYVKKEAAAKRIEANKVVIIGGSASHFGFSAEYLTTLTGIPSVNLGTHAGLGIEYLLHRAKRSLKRGDIAIVAIEPQLFHSLSPTTVLAERVLRDDLGYLTHTSPLSVVKLMFGLSPAAVLQTEAHRLIPWTSPIARADTVSEFGDETLEVSKHVHPGTREGLEKAGTIPLVLPIPARPPRPLESFFRWARENGVQVAHAWTPMLRHPAYDRPDFRTYFDGVTRWYVEGGALTLGSARDYFLSLDEIFDFVLHANEHGKIKATEALARGLCAAVNCPAKTAPSNR